MTQTLYMREGNSDKQYTVTITESSNGYGVVAFYGRRGGTQKQQNKSTQPLTLVDATKLYESVINEKLAKGYKIGESAAPITPDKPAETTNGAFQVSKRNDFRPMLLTSITDPEPYLKSDDWLMQEKEDGVRGIIHVANGEAKAYSRNDLPVAITRESSQIIAKVFDDCIIDVEVIGEVVIILDFLSHCDVDLRGYTCKDRLRALTLFMGAIPVGGNVRMIETTETESDKREMIARMYAKGAEGVVFKKTSSKYTAGRGGPALKLKFKATASLRVVAIGTNNKASVDVALEDGTVIASVSTIGRPIPAINQLLEIEYLYVHRGGKLIQPVYKSIRADKTIADTFADLQYVREARKEE